MANEAAWSMGKNEKARDILIKDINKDDEQMIEDLGSLLNDKKEEHGSRLLNAGRAYLLLSEHHDILKDKCDTLELTINRQKEQLEQFKSLMHSYFAIHRQRNELETQILAIIEDGNLSGHMASALERKKNV